MAKIQNVSGQDLVVPALGGRKIVDQQIVDLSDYPGDLDVYGFTQSTNWDPADEDAETAHDDGHQAYLERRSEELGGVPVDDDGVPIPPEVLEEPGGNASREVWADYVLSARLATEDDLDGKGRDEIRDTYTNGSN